LRARRHLPEGAPGRPGGCDRQARSGALPVRRGGAARRVRAARGGPSHARPGRPGRARPRGPDAARRPAARASVALAGAAAVAMLLQTTVFPTVPGLPIVPDVVLVLAIYVAVRRQSTGGAVGAFLLGYFLDTFSGTLLGLNAFSLTAAYLAVQWLARHLWVERGLPVVGVVLFGGVVRETAAVAVA